MKYALILFMCLPLFGKAQTIIITEDVIMKTHNHTIIDKDDYDCSVNPCRLLTADEKINILRCKVEELQSEVKELSCVVQMLLLKSNTK